MVAGVVGGRRLVAPPGRATRPTGDRVREAMFSTLAATVALEGVAVADLFAGSGALGIEALSRGAATAVFVDTDHRARTAINDNLAALGLGGAGTTVLAVDAVAAAGRPEVATAGVVFADPPYRFDGWAQLLRRLGGAGFRGVVVAETGGAQPVADGWGVLRQKAYGSTLVTMVQPAEQGRKVGA